MNAEEARAIALKEKWSKAHAALSDIRAKIEEAAKKGEFNTSVCTPVPSTVITELMAEGFTVKENHFRNEYSCFISW